ncbi:MAG: hypothetical protein JWM88_565, partial [Verrucomicrobia bacterium]|nr:hypothetical protein [Verrucomicrobiota bacterium]
MASLQPKADPDSSQVWVRQFRPVGQGIGRKAWGRFARRAWRSVSRIQAAAITFAAAFLLGGCLNTTVATMMVKAPNQQRVPAIVRNKAYAAKYDGLYSRAWRVAVGPPAAEISVAVIEPGDYHFNYELVPMADGNGRHWLSPRMDWTVPVRRETNPSLAKGTVVLLHGYLETKEDMVHWALRLAESGYRAVLLDLRGQGRSSGAWIGYGAFEAHDLVQILDDLRAKGLAPGKVGVLGVSYGASVALLWAARDSRVGAVVALAP